MPTNPPERTVTLVGTQLEFHTLVYAVAPAVPSQNKEYMIFASVGFCDQKSEFKNHHHCRFAEADVKIVEAHQSIPIIANPKIPKA